MESRVAALVGEFTPVLDDFEAIALAHLRDYFGCDAAYFATIGPHFVERSPGYFREILADPQRFDPGQKKAQEIVARFGPAFVDTEAYTPGERDRLPTFRELLRPAGISSIILATVNVGAHTTGMLHLVRSARPFSHEALAKAAPLLRTIAILHRAIVGAPNAADDAALDRIARLTSREHEVARLAGDGFQPIQIAAHLGTSVNTVRRQLESIYKKLGIGNRAELAIVVQRAQRVTGDIDAGLLRILTSVKLRA